MKETTSVKEKLNYWTVSVIGLGYFCINLSLCYYDPITPVYLGHYTKSALIIGLLSTIGFLFSAVLQPYMGALSDRITPRVGRRKLFMLIGMPLSALFFVLISYSNSLAALIVFIIGFNVAFSIYRVPSMSLMPDLTPQKLWSSANGVINLLGGVGALVAYIVCGNLYDTNHHYPFFLIAAALIVSVLLIGIFVKEKPTTAPANENGAKEEHVGVVKAFAFIVREKDKSALLLLISIFLRFMGYNGFEDFIALFGLHQLKITVGQSTVLIGIMAISFIIFAVPSGMIAQKIGRKKSVVIGLALMFASFFACGLVHSYIAIAALGLLGGLGYALANINGFPMLINIGGKAKVGVYTGLYYFFYSLAAVAAPTVFGWLISVCGYGSMFFFSCGFLLLALLATLGIKRGEATESTEADA